jgi:histone deacetylase 1/2
MTLRDLYARLLNTEQRIASRRTSEGYHDYHDSALANAASRRGGKSQYRPTPSAPGGGKPSAPSPPSTGGRARACCPSSGTKLPCQLCGLDGHLASRCHRRFKLDFLGIGNNGKGNECQVSMATTPGYTPSYPVDVPWYMDSGATDHLTSEMNKLNARESYQGTDKVHTANGAGMHISHIGQDSVPTHTSKQLRLSNILHVPSVTRDLLSVHRLTLDNNVFCEFHPFDLFVKDRDTRDVLLRGRCRRGLYELDAPSTFTQVFSGVRTSSSQWHSRLGHPATPIVHHVLHRHELSVQSSSHSDTVYDACQQGKSHQLPFSESSRVVKTPLELVFSDVWGHTQTSISGHNYYVSFIDAYSRFTWLYLIKRKSDVFDVFLQFQAHVKRLLKTKIISVQSDWGGEYHNLNTFF